MKNPLEALLDLLDARVFQPTASADPLSYSSFEDRKLLKRVQQRVQNTRVRYIGEYSTPAQIKSNFVQDLNSKPGQELATDMYLLKLPRFEDIREEFLALCQKLGV